MSKGYNIEVQPIKDSNRFVYNIPDGGHLVIVLKQTRVNGDFAIAATGILVRALGILSLDVIVDPD